MIAMTKSSLVTGSEFFRFKFFGPIQRELKSIPQFFEALESSVSNGTQGGSIKDQSQGLRIIC
jgi:hypothetical protein